MAIAASDGGYYPDSHTTAAAWTIESEDGKEFISGMATPHFSPAELTGLLSIVHMASYLCLTHNLTNPSLLITCANIKALESCFDTPIEKLHPKQKH